MEFIFRHARSIKYQREVDRSFHINKLDGEEKASAKDALLALKCNAFIAICQLSIRLLEVFNFRREDISGLYSLVKGTSSEA